MEGYILDWLNLLGRWVHMITGIAWIGASFYFIWLDNHLEPVKDPADDEKGVSGELWALHGGGIYHAQKYKLAPNTLPDNLHWFKWEAYTTWITGMFMMALIYWYGADLYLIDPSVADLSKPVAILIGIATIVVGWLVYDFMCKSALGNDDKKLAVALFIFVAIVAFVLTHLFSGRGAFMHYGAMLGTIMVGNVFFTIMPGQRALLACAESGDPVDPEHGRKAKQRSVHNTYFTLPVLFVMISNHYAVAFGHWLNWLILIGISIAGALIRIYFVQRHFGRNKPVYLGFAAVILLAVSFVMAPSASNSATSAVETKEQLTTKAVSIVQERCSTCHAAAPTYAGFSAAPKGMMYDTEQQIVSQALMIHQQAVVSKAMPLANLTKITDEERATLDRWFKSLQ
ncbi:MAG: urate hydroxylase PuuD [Cocleimonas sp.]